jgi:hypothetical protein
MKRHTKILLRVILFIILSVVYFYSHEKSSNDSFRLLISVFYIISSLFILDVEIEN